MVGTALFNFKEGVKDEERAPGSGRQVPAQSTAGRMRLDYVPVISRIILDKAGHAI
jgi:hypothetical protein